LTPINIKSKSFCILVALSFMIELWASFSKICLVDCIVYIACGLNSSVTNFYEIMLLIMS